MNPPNMKTPDELEEVISKIGDVLDSSDVTVADAMAVLTLVLAEATVYHGVDPRIVFTNLMAQINGLKEEQEAAALEQPSPLITLN